MTKPSAAVSGVYRNSHTNGNYTFSMMVPKIRDEGTEGLYATMPVNATASVDLSSSNLTITKQITGLSVSSNEPHLMYLML